MSYGRNPYYIYSNGSQLYLNGVYVPEDVIDAFLYKILFKCRREELKNRLKNGKEQWLNNKYTITEEFEYKEIPISEEEIQMIKRNEDEILKQLMGE